MAEGHYTGLAIDKDVASEEGTIVELLEDNAPVTRSKRKAEGDDPGDPKKHKHLPSTSAPKNTQAGVNKMKTIIRMLEQIQKTQDIIREEIRTHNTSINHRLKTMEETITRIQQDCNTRMGVIEARVTALQIARRDQAVDVLIAPSTQPTAPLTTPHTTPASTSGGGLFTKH